MHVSCWINTRIPARHTGCPKNVSIKNFNCDQFITLIHSFYIHLDSVDLQVLLDISFIRVGRMYVKLQSFLDVSVL